MKDKLETVKGGIGGEIVIAGTLPFLRDEFVRLFTPYAGI